MAFSRYIICFIVGTIPLLFAAVQPWIWTFYTICIFAAFFILFVKSQDIRTWIPGKLFIVLVGLFFAVALIQCLPLPASVLSFLSPFRFKILFQANAILDNQTLWHPISYASRASFAWWIFLMSVSLFYLVFRKTCYNYKHLKLLIHILFIIAVLEALYGLLQALIPTMGVLWVDYLKASIGSARGTYINRNHFAGFIEMILPLGLGYTLSLSSWREKLSIKALMSTDRPNFQFFLTISLAVMLLALIFSKSRVGITGWGLGFLTFALLVHFGSKGLPKSYWVIIGIIIGMVTFYSLRIGVDPVIERFLRISKDASRLDYWRDSLVIIKEHPFGTGLATFKQVFSVFNISSFSTPHYAHNDYLQLLVETGWIGFVTLVSGFYIFLVRSFRRVKQIKLQDDPFRFFMAIGALSGLVSIAFHSFFDFNLQIPANCVYFVMLLGIVDITLWQNPT
jgi:O-antigen ligase